MKLMKKLLMVLALLPVLAVASEGGYPLDHAPDRSRQLPALQNGAKLFVNYCLNCHAASLVRYNRLRDIGLSEPQIRDNLLFTSDKVGDLMKTAMNEKDPPKAREAAARLFEKEPAPWVQVLVARACAAAGDHDEACRELSAAIDAIAVDPTRVDPMVIHLPEELEAGDDWEPPRLNINLAYARRKHLSAKVRTFIDFMVEHFARMDYERKWTARFGL